MALGGTAGVHLSDRWDLAVSRNTLLRLLRRLPVPSLPTPTLVLPLYEQRAVALLGCLHTRSPGTPILVRAYACKA